MHINNEYVYQGGPYDLEDLFSLKNVTEVSREFVFKTTSEKLSQMWKALQAETVPTVDTGPHCTSPYRCPFYSHCHQQVTDHPISDLPRGSRDFLDGLKESGIEDIRLIPADYPGLNTLQKQVRECVVNDSAFVGPELLTKLQEINFPVSFLDFETFDPVLPVYVCTSPYQAEPFQWSLHNKPMSGHLSHMSFL